MEPPFTRFFFFFNDTATTEIYTLSLHDALPIFPRISAMTRCARARGRSATRRTIPSSGTSSRSSTAAIRSEEHTSELQSQSNLVCRLLLEKKKKNKLTRLTIMPVNYEDVHCRHQ